MCRCSSPTRTWRAPYSFSHVQTTQIAPTILKLLGLKPSKLIGVQKEDTHVLPGF